MNVGTAFRRCCFIINVLLLLFFISLSLSSQTIPWKWAVNTGGENYNSSHVNAVSNDGSVYAGGEFDSQLNISDDLNEFVFSPVGGYDIFICKYSNDGLLLEAFAIRGDGDEYISALETDYEGNLYVAGYFQQSIIFGEGSNTIELNCENEYDNGFLAKYDEYGTLEFAHLISGTANTYPGDMVIDNEENLLVSGSFSGQLILNDTLSLESNDGLDIFIAKYNKINELLWAFSDGGEYLDEAVAIDTGPDNSVYLCGIFWQETIFDGIELFSNGNFDIFIAKLGADGNFNWVRSGGSQLLDRVTDITVDASGATYLTGYFQDTAWFGQDDTIVELYSAGNTDIYIVKYNSTGDLVWANADGGQGFDEGNNIVFDGYNRIYIAGAFSETANFGIDVFNHSYTSLGLKDLFISKYKVDGMYVWTSTNGSLGSDYAYALDIDTLGNVFISGTIAGDIQINEFELRGQGAGDIFLANIQNPFSGFPESKTTEQFIYPNPNNGSFYLQFVSPLRIDKISIFNITGEKIHSEDLSVDNLTYMEIRIPSEQSPGIYWLTIDTNKGLLTGKFILN